MYNTVLYHASRNAAQRISSQTETYAFSRSFTWSSWSCPCRLHPPLDERHGRGHPSHHVSDLILHGPHRASRSSVPPRRVLIRAVCKPDGPPSLARTCPRDGRDETGRLLVGYRRGGSRITGWFLLAAASGKWSGPGTNPSPRRASCVCVAAAVLLPLPCRPGPASLPSYGTVWMTPFPPAPLLSSATAEGPWGARVVGW